MLSTGGSQLAVFVLALLIATAGAAGARADDPNSGGDITVTVVDPTASPTPSSAPSSSGTPSPSRRSTGGGNTDDSPTSASTAEAGAGAGGIAKWIIVSGLDSDVSSELNPLRGQVHSSVTVANRSSTATVSGALVFRLRSFIGIQLGPSVTRQIIRLRPGGVSETSADLIPIGQWPLVQVSATFQPSGAARQAPIVREAWVVGSPWLLVVLAILALAIFAIALIRRGATAGILRPEAAV